MNKEFTIYEIIDYLIGHTDIYCECNHDRVSYENLDILNDVVIYLMKKLFENASHYGDNRISANSIANKSIKLTKNIKEWCEDIISFEELENGDNKC